MFQTNLKICMEITRYLYRVFVVTVVTIFQALAIVGEKDGSNKSLLAFGHSQTAILRI